MEEAAIDVPEGFTLHSENSAHILLPNNNEAFLNPVQEFNRDLSVACIRTWSDIVQEEKKRKWEVTQERRARKAQNGNKAKRPKSTRFLRVPAIILDSLHSSRGRC